MHAIAAVIEKNEKKYFKSVACNKSMPYICIANNLKSHD